MPPTDQMAPATGAAAPGTTPAGPPVDDSIGGLFRRLVDDLINLVRSELRLAGSEVSGKIEESATSLGAIALGMILISVAMFCLLGAAVAFLAQFVGIIWAALIVAAVAIAIGGGLIYWGITSLQAQQLAPSRTVANLMRNAELLKGD